MKSIRPFCWILFFAIASSCKSPEEPNQRTAGAPDTFTTPLGKSFEIPPPSDNMLDLFEQAKADYEQDPDHIDHIIWYGRRTAYLPRYEEAIAIYTEGIEKYPDEPRLYRHRGHRYISIREFDKAIADLEKAAALIKGTENEIEPDGLPNAQGIPVSSLHGNIWYHLGLAYYLKHDLAKAFEAYTQCRNAHNYDDNLVSSTHWLYMIQRRMGNEALANEQLVPIHDTMNIIENFSYYNLCKLYKGLVPIDSLTAGEGSAGDAVKYGLANWELYHGNAESARDKMDDILKGPTWNSFGYIAAESDYPKYFDQ